MFTLKHSLPIFSREIRLGLVLYGGVSLAIYMNGICREFYNAIRGRGVYKLIKALTDSDIVVDIVSGTSAGGVNGVLLSYAIANSNQDAVLDFKDFANLWIENGDIEKLLRKPIHGKNKSRFDSVLDGEGFYQAGLVDAFKDETSHPPEDDWYSDFGELDLFVTATDLDGRINKVPDNTGKVIEIKDHRAVFHLKYRQDQVDYIEDPFKPEKITRKALAKLCRITSCFPVAFPVVNIKLDSEGDSEDSKLINWGKLNHRELSSGNKEECVLYFVDGGVLNNRPFSSTIQTIYARTAFRPTDRKLFYIDPNPEQFLNNTSLQPSTSRSPKNPFQIAFDSKIEIPNYQSISRDLEYIKEGNRKVIRYQLLRQSLEQKDTHKLAQFISSNESSASPKYSEFEYANYLKCRLLGLLDDSIQEILVSTDGKTENYEKFLHEAAELLNRQVLSKAVEEYYERIYKEITPLDITFLIRKYCFLLEILAKETQKSQEENNIRQYLQLRYLTYQISWQRELLQIIQKALNQILNEFDFDEILEEGQEGKTQIDKLYSFLIASRRVLLGTGSNNYELARMAHKDLLTTGDKDIALEEEQTKSWKSLLATYYELFKIIHFPDDIDFEGHPIDWAALKILLPEQKTSLARKIFSQIYQMPTCQILAIKTSSERKRKISRLKMTIAKKMNNNPQESYQEGEGESILSIIEKHSRQLIENSLIDVDLKDKLIDYFERFESIDKVLYPYEYLSEKMTRNTIDLVRVSPNDANKLGFGKGKNIQIKLKGYALNAFGGFFKKAWRTNDILWGRLDGLDRIITALITPQSIKNFAHFLKKYKGDWTLQEYLERLIDESLPHATNDERTVIVNYLQCISSDSPEYSTHNQKGFEVFLDHVVKAGQRYILLEDSLTEDLKQTAEIMRKSQASDKQIVSALQSSLEVIKQQSEDQPLDDSLIRQLDEHFEEYQDIKASLIYNRISFVKSLWLNLLKITFRNQIMLKEKNRKTFWKILFAALIWGIWQECWNTLLYFSPRRRIER